MNCTCAYYDTAENKVYPAGIKKIEILSFWIILNLIYSRQSFLITTFLSIPILYLWSSIFFNLFFNINSRLSFPILTFLSLTILHQFFIISFYLLLNHNTRLSLWSSPFLSHSILHLWTSIFFHLFVSCTESWNLYILQFQWPDIFINPEKMYAHSIRLCTSSVVWKGV